jgi:hypothetical protein
MAGKKTRSLIGSAALLAVLAACAAPALARVGLPDPAANATAQDAADDDIRKPRAKIEQPEPPRPKNPRGDFLIIHEAPPAAKTKKAR